MSSPLVGLVGYAQSGKDTFAKYLGYQRIAFADTLKDLAIDSGPRFSYDTGEEYTLGEIVAQSGWEFAKAEVHGVREFLQDLGIAVREHIGPDTWVNAAFRRWDPSVPTVFTDVRFPNEIAAIRERGGIIIRIDRVGNEPVNSHVSEFAWQEAVPDEHFTFANGALRHMELVAISLAGRL